MKTRLVGVHWATSVLAALTAALVCKVPLERAISAIEKVEPFWARLQPVTIPSSGAVVLRDDWNGSSETFDAAFAVMEQATAARKVMVISDYSDTNTTLRARATRLGRRAAQLADMLVFVGAYAEQSRTAALREASSEVHAHAFSTTRAAAHFLRNELQRGDLVLLKGQANHHLTRIYLGLLGDVSCNKLSCSRQVLCDLCGDVGLSLEREELRHLVYRDISAGPTPSA